MKATILVALLFLAGCSTTMSGSLCVVPSLYYHQPVYDAMTDAERAKHLSYLKTGEKLCGWKPPR